MVDPDEFLEAIGPLAVQGNEFALVAQARVVMAEDRAAEVERIIDDYGRLLRRISEIVKPLFDALGEGLVQTLGQPAR